MTTRQEKVQAEVDNAWRELQDTLAQVPPERLAEVGVEGPWSVKDLIGHISTWEIEAMDGVGRYLPGQDLGEPAWPEDINWFNARSVEGKRSTPLAEVLDNFEKSHAGLVRFVKGIGEDALGVSEVETRIRVDTFEHYVEHAATIRQWLDRGAR